MGQTYFFAVVIIAFLAGSLMAWSRFPSSIFPFFLYTVFSLIGFVAIAKPLRYHLKTSMVIWVMFLYYFVAYYLKFFVLCWSGLYAEETLIVGYGLISSVFLIFCVTTRLMFTDVKVPWKTYPVPVRVSITSNVKWVVPLVYAIVMLCLGLVIYMTYHYGIGIMASSEKIILPWKLSGITENISSRGIPILFTLLLFWGFLKGDKKVLTLTFLLMGLLGAYALFLKTSKSMIFYMIVIALLVNLLVYGGMRRKAVSAFIGLFGLYLGLYPFFMEYRSWRNSVTQFSGSLVSNWASGILGQNSLGSLANGFNQLLNRFTGAESLLDMISMNIGSILGLGVFNVSAASYFTKAAYDIDPGTHASASGFVGWMYIVGGTPFVLLFAVFFMFVTYKIWLAITFSPRITAKPFVQTVFILMLLNYFGEGNFIIDKENIVSIVLMYVGVVGLIIFGEWLTRKFIVITPGGANETRIIPERA